MGTCFFHQSLLACWRSWDIVPRVSADESRPCIPISRFSYPYTRGRGSHIYQIPQQQPGIESNQIESDTECTREQPLLRHRRGHLALSMSRAVQRCGPSQQALASVLSHRCCSTRHQRFCGNSIIMATGRRDPFDHNHCRRRDRVRACSPTALRLLLVAVSTDHDTCSVTCVSPTASATPRLETSAAIY